MAKYVLGIDQSTQGTKAILFDGEGALLARADRPHRQIVNDRGWVEHDPEEIYRNVVATVADVVAKASVDRGDIACVGISNQRETSLVWNADGTPCHNAIVWQDARATDVCERVAAAGMEEAVRERSGIRLSPYFPAAKLAWICEHVDGVARGLRAGKLRLGTVDAYLVYRLTHGESYKTDYSNASRTELFDIRRLAWDEELCDAFGIPVAALPEVCDSDAPFGMTDFGGYLDAPIPIHAVMGDSHGALFGQGCLRPGMVKATYGTGSSVMMNVGESPVTSESGLVSSLAWKLGGKVSYVLEGNINYTGAVVTWLKDDLGLIESAGETEELARVASERDQSYLVPAFSGLGAPYWDSAAVGVLYGMTRTTHRAEIVRAALDSIGYQITDVLRAMERDSGVSLGELRVDGGPTHNGYLMQFQSDIARVPVAVSPTEELSGMGVAYAAGCGMGIYDADRLFDGVERRVFRPKRDEAWSRSKYDGWRHAVSKALSETEERS